MRSRHAFGLCLLLVAIQACQGSAFEPLPCDKWQPVEPRTGASFDFGVTPDMQQCFTSAQSVAKPAAARATD